MGFCMYCGRKLAEGENCNCQNNMVEQQISMGMSNMRNMQQTTASYRSCKKCGAPLKQNDKFCDICGTPVENIEERNYVQQPYRQNNQQMSNQRIPVQQSYQQQNQQIPNSGMVQSQYQQQMSAQQQNIPKKKKKAGKIVAIFAFLCVLLFAVGAGAFYFMGGQSSYKNIVKTFCEGKLGGDTDKIFETFPEEVTIKLAGDDMFNAMKESMTTANQMSEALLGDSYKYSYDITNEETLSEEEIEELAQKYKDADMELKSSISEAKEVDVAMQASLGGADMNIGTYTIKCFKMGGKWYVDYFSAL